MKQKNNNPLKNNTHIDASGALDAAGTALDVSDAASTFLVFFLDLVGAASASLDASGATSLFYFSSLTCLVQQGHL